MDDVPAARLALDQGLDSGAVRMPSHRADSCGKTARDLSKTVEAPAWSWYVAGTLKSARKASIESVIQRHCCTSPTGPVGSPRISQSLLHVFMVTFLPKPTLDQSSRV